MLLQLLQTGTELAMGGSTKTANADISHPRANHIGGIDRLDGYLVARDNETQGVSNASTHDAEVDLRTLGTTQTTHNLLLGHLHTSNGSIIDTDNAVACHDAHLLRGTTTDGLDDEQGVFHHVKLHTDALKVALQGFVGRLHLLGCQIAAMRVKLLKHTSDTVLHQFLLVDTINI